MGVGSEVYSPVSQGRKAIGIELKDSYSKQAKINLSLADKRFDGEGIFIKRTCLRPHDTRPARTSPRCTLLTCSLYAHAAPIRKHRTMPQNAPNGLPLPTLGEYSQHSRRTVLAPLRSYPITLD